MAAFAELNNFNRDYMVHTDRNIYYLALRRKKKFVNP